MIVDAGMSRETSELGDLLDLLDRPKAVTLSMVAKKANEYTTREEFGKTVELLLNRPRLVVTTPSGCRRFRVPAFSACSFGT